MSPDIEIPANDAENPPQDNHNISNDGKVKFLSTASQWPASKKWSATLTATIVTFLVGINSTALLSATDEVSEHFDIDNSSFDNSFFLVTAWNAGAAIVPLVILPAMEDFGIRQIYIGLYIVFTIFVMVQAVAHNFATLIVARVIAGSCGGALQNAIDGMVADIWSQDTRRMSFCLSLFILALTGGVTIGSVIGGLIIRSLSWRWYVNIVDKVSSYTTNIHNRVSWIQLIIYGAFLPIVILFIHDTRTSSAPQDAAAIKARIKSALNETVLRSSKMFVTEFVVSSFTFWSAFSFGTVFILTQSIPLVYRTRYSWSEADTGIVQMSLFIGEIIGFCLCLVQDFVIYPRYSSHAPKEKRGQKQKHPSNHATPPETRSHPSISTSTLPPNPEARLYTSIPASLLGLTAGFFIYGWTSQPSSSYSYPWPLPTLGLLLIGLGIMIIIQAVTTYITDCYPTNANSAVSCVAFGENMFAAFLPLATRRMYERLGVGWASSTLGFLAVAVSAGPMLIVLFGPKIRRRSRLIG